MQKKRILHLPLMLKCCITSIVFCSQSFAGGKNFVEPERINELVFSLGYGSQGGDDQDNTAFVVDYQFMQWSISEKWKFYLGTGYSHIKCNCDAGDSVNALSFGPGLKYHFAANCYIKPYFYLSIAPTYVDSLTLGTQEQGSHFLFSDPFGFGAYFGEDFSWIATIGRDHLSNGSLFPPNSGYDVPINIGIGRRF